MKVLSLYWGFFGGIAKYGLLLNKLNECDDMNIHHLCVTARQWHTDRAALDQIQNRTLINITSRKDLSWIHRLKSIIRNFAPDLVMTHGFNGHMVIMLEKKLFMRDLHLICSHHGLYHATTPLRRLVEPFFNKLTELHIRRNVISVVAVSESIRRYLRLHGVRNELMKVVHNGIEKKSKKTAGRRSIRCDLDITEKEIIIGSTSRLDPVKGIRYLVSAFRALSNRRTNLKLLILGSGTCERELREYCARENIGGSVFFLGFVPDIDDYLDSLDIFVLPSLAEYHSISLLEAMRAGKAIVATNVGGNTEAVRHEKEALIVPPGDSGALARALQILVTDARLRRTLGRAARNRFLDEFTVDAMLSQTYSWLQRCKELASLNGHTTTSCR